MAKVTWLGIVLDLLQIDYDPLSEEVNSLFKS
jgi:hypothetical protein